MTIYSKLMEKGSGQVKTSDAETPTDILDNGLLTEIKNEILEKLEYET